MKRRDPFDYTDWDRRDLDALLLSTSVPNKEKDSIYEWCLTDSEVLTRYAGRYVVACRKEILGEGRTLIEALTNADSRMAELGIRQSEVIWMPIPL